MPWLHGDWIDDDESLARPPSRWAFDAYLRESFEQAGWTPLLPPALIPQGDATTFAQALLDEFGGLKLNVGTAEEVVFFDAPLPLPRSDTQRWPSLAGSMVIASVKNTYAVLFVDRQGKFYATDDICHELYALGAEFVDAANILMRSLPWSRAACA